MPLTTMLLAERARRGARAMPSLQQALPAAAAPLSALAAARVTQHHAAHSRGAATTTGPRKDTGGTTADEDQRWDTYGAMPASPGGVPEPVPKGEEEHADALAAETTPAPGGVAATRADESGVRERVRAAR
jgi:hypothetical protein